MFPNIDSIHKVTYLLRTTSLFKQLKLILIQLTSAHPLFHLILIEQKPLQYSSISQYS